MCCGLWVVWALLTAWVLVGANDVGGGGSGAGSPRLVNQEGGPGEPLPRPGAATREREIEIAAIFRGVAYGAPTTVPPLPSPAPPPTPTPLLEASITPMLSPDATHTPESKKNTTTRKEGIPERTIGGSPNVHVSEGNTSYHGMPADPWGNTTYIRLGLGPAWSARVVVGGAWGLLGAAALVLLVRVVGATSLLPAPRYLALHLLLVSSAAARGLYLLPPLTPLPPPPAAVVAAAGEGAWPLLTAGAAIVAGGAAVAWVTTPRPRLAMALTLAAPAHLLVLLAAHLSVVFLGAPRPPLALAATALAVVWGAVVGVAGVWAAWAAGRNSCPILSDVGGGGAGQECGRPRGPAVLLLWAGLGQVSGAGARVWVVAAPPGLEWTWWGSLALPHALDLVVGVALLGAAARTLPTPTPGTPRSWWWGRRAGEGPPSVKVVQPLGVYTVTPAPVPPKTHHARTLAGLGLSAGRGGRGARSLDYVTTDFQLVWSHPRPTAPEHPGEGNYHHLSQSDLVPMGPGVMAPEVFTCTLPSYKLYAAPGSYHLGDTLEGGAHHLSRTSATLSRSSWRGSTSPQVSLRGSRSWDQLSSHHIYEEPHPPSHTTHLSDTPSPATSPVPPRLPLSRPPCSPSTPTSSSPNYPHPDTGSPTLTPLHLPHPARRPLAHHHH